MEPIFVFRLALISRTRAKLNGGKPHNHAGDTGAEGAARLRRTHRTLPRFHGGGRHGRPRFISANTTTNTTTASCLLTKGTSHSKILVLVIESIDDWMGYWQEVTETRHVPAPSLCLNHPYQPTPIVGGLGPSRERACFVLFCFVWMIEATRGL